MLLSAICSHARSERKRLFDFTAAHTSGLARYVSELGNDRLILLQLRETDLARAHVSNECSSSQTADDSWPPFPGRDCNVHGRE